MSREQPSQGARQPCLPLQAGLGVKCESQHVLPGLGSMGSLALPLSSGIPSACGAQSSPILGAGRQARCCTAGVHSESRQARGVEGLQLHFSNDPSLCHVFIHWETLRAGRQEGQLCSAGVEEEVQGWGSSVQGRGRARRGVGRGRGTPFLLSPPALLCPRLPCGLTPARHPGANLSPAMCQRSRASW